MEARVLLRFFTTERNERIDTAPTHIRNHHADAAPQLYASALAEYMQHACSQSAPHVCLCHNPGTGNSTSMVKAGTAG